MPNEIVEGDDDAGGERRDPEERQRQHRLGRATAPRARSATREHDAADEQATISGSVQPYWFASMSP